MSSLRLFIAFWPERSWAEGVVASVRRSLIAEGAMESARLLPAENLHLTLLFLGNVSADIAQSIRAVARTLPVAPQEPLCLERLSFVASKSLLALVAQSVPLCWRQYAAAVHERFANTFPELRLSLRPFWPHVTLVRRAEGAFCSALQIKPWCIAAPTRAHLVRSELGGRASRYTFWD